MRLHTAKRRKKLLNARPRKVHKKGPRAFDDRFGSFAIDPSRPEIHLCLLWSKSGQTRTQLDCLLIANSWSDAEVAHKILCLLFCIIPTAPNIDLLRDSQIRESLTQIGRA